MPDMIKLHFLQLLDPFKFYTKEVKLSKSIKHKSPEPHSTIKKYYNKLDIEVSESDANTIKQFGDIYFIRTWYALEKESKYNYIHFEAFNIQGANSMIEIFCYSNEFRRRVLQIQEFSSTDINRKIRYQLDYFLDEPDYIEIIRKR
jgi:hypothetical protein